VALRDPTPHSVLAAVAIGVTCSDWARLQPNRSDKVNYVKYDADGELSYSIARLQTKGSLSRLMSRG